MVIWDEMLVGLNKQIGDLTKFLVSGQASDYASYREIVGRIEGIELSKQVLHHIVKSSLYSEDDDDDIQNNQTNRKKGR
jgi:hypothetical protein